MKATIKNVLCAAAAAMLSAVSCQKSIDSAGLDNKVGETIDINVNGLMGEYSQDNDTKATIVNNVRVSWEGNETVYVYDGTGCLGSLAASLDEGEDRYALLSTDESHTVKAPAQGTTKLTLIYSPLLTSAPSVSGGAISISLAEQNSESAPFVAYATMDYNGEKTIEKAIVPFKFATSVIRVNCTGLRAAKAIKYASLSNVNTICKLSLSGTAAPTVAGEGNGTITRTGDAYFAAGKVNSEGEAVFQMAVPRLDAAADGRALAVSQYARKFVDYNFTTKALNPATSVNTVCQMPDDGVLAGVFTVNAEGHKVRFSQGNLYARRESTTDSWKLCFHDDQYETETDRPVQDRDLQIELFTWGYVPSKSLIPTNVDYVEAHRAAETLIYDKASTAGGDDWGVAYCEYNGLELGHWNTLSKTEWDYLLNSRTMKNGGPRASRNINYRSQRGCVLYPDDYSGPELSAQTKYTEDIFPDDCVFLPESFIRMGALIDVEDERRGYWTGTSGSFFDSAFYFIVTSTTLGTEDIPRSRGLAVRLVTNVN